MEGHCNLFDIVQEYNRGNYGGFLADLIACRAYSDLSSGFGKKAVNSMVARAVYVLAREGNTEITKYLDRFGDMAHKAFATGFAEYAVKHPSIDTLAELNKLKQYLPDQIYALARHYMFLTLAKQYVSSQDWKDLDRLIRVYREGGIVSGDDRIISMLLRIEQLFKDKDRLAELAAVEFMKRVESELKDIVKKIPSMTPDEISKYAGLLEALGYDVDTVRDAIILRDTGLHKEMEKLSEYVKELKAAKDKYTVMGLLYDIAREAKTILDKLEAVKGELSSKTYSMYTGVLRQVIGGLIGAAVDIGIASDYSLANEYISLARRLGLNTDKYENELKVFKTIKERGLSAREILGVLYNLGYPVTGVPGLNLGELYLKDGTVRYLVDVLNYIRSEDTGLFNKVVERLALMAYNKEKDPRVKEAIILSMAKYFDVFKPAAEKLRQIEDVRNMLKTLATQVNIIANTIAKMLSSGDIDSAKRLLSDLDTAINKYEKYYEEHVGDIKNTDVYHVLEATRNILWAQVLLAEMVKAINDAYASADIRIKKGEDPVKVYNELSDKLVLLSNKLQNIYDNYMNDIKKLVDNAKHHIDAIRDQNTRASLVQAWKNLYTTMKNVDEQLSSGHIVDALRALSVVYNKAADTWRLYEKLIDLLKGLGSRYTYTDIRPLFKKVLDLLAEDIYELYNYRSNYKIVLCRGSTCSDREVLSVSDQARSIAKAFIGMVNNIVAELAKSGDERIVNDVVEVLKKYGLFKLPEITPIEKATLPISEAVGFIVDANNRFIREVWDQIYKGRYYVALALPLAVLGATGAAMIDYLTTLVRPRALVYQGEYLLNGFNTLIRNPAGWLRGAEETLRAMFGTPEAATMSIGYILAGVLLARGLSRISSPVTRRIASLVVNTLQGDPIGLAGDIFEVTGVSRKLRAITVKIGDKIKTVILDPKVVEEDKALYRVLGAIDWSKIRKDILAKLLKERLAGLTDVLGVDMEKLSKKGFAKALEQVYKLFDEKYDDIVGYAKAKAELENAIRSLAEEVQGTTKYTASIQMPFERLRFALRNLSLELSPEKMEAIIKKIENARESMVKYADALKKLGFEDAAKKVYDLAKELDSLEDDIRRLRGIKGFVEQVESIKRLRASELREANTKMANALEKILRDIRFEAKELPGYSDVEKIVKTFEKLNSTDPIRAYLYLKENMDKISAFLEKAGSELSDLTSRAVSINAKYVTRMVDKIDSMLKDATKYISAVGESVSDDLIRFASKTGDTRLIKLAEDIRKYSRALMETDPVKNYRAFLDNLARLSDAVSKLRGFMDTMSREELARIVDDLERLRKAIKRAYSRSPAFAMLDKTVDEVYAYALNYMGKYAHVGLDRYLETLEYYIKKLGEEANINVSGELELIKNIRELIKNKQYRKAFTELEVLIKRLSKKPYTVGLVPRLKELILSISRMPDEELRKLGVNPAEFHRFIANIKATLDDIVVPPDKFVALFSEFREARGRPIPAIFVEKDVADKLKNIFRKTAEYDIEYEGRRLKIYRKGILRNNGYDVLFIVYDPDKKVWVGYKISVDIVGNPTYTWFKSKLGSEARFRVYVDYIYDPKVPEEAKLMAIVKKYENAGKLPELFKGYDILTKYIYVPVFGGVLKPVGALARAVYAVTPMVVYGGTKYYYRILENIAKEFMEKYRRPYIYIYDYKNKKLIVLPLNKENLKKILPLLKNINNISVIVPGVDIKTALKLGVYGISALSLKTLQKTVQRLRAEQVEEEVEKTAEEERGIPKPPVAGGVPLAPGLFITAGGVAASVEKILGMTREKIALI